MCMPSGSVLNRPTGKQLLSSHMLTFNSVWSGCCDFESTTRISTLSRRSAIGVWATASEEAKTTAKRKKTARLNIRGVAITLDNAEDNRCARRLATTKQREDRSR